MDDCPLVDKVIVADKNTGSLLKQGTEVRTQIRILRKAKFDLAIDFRTGTRGSILAWISGAPQRIAFYSDHETFWRNWGFTHLVDLPYKLGTYVADYYHQILSAFGLSAQPGPLRLWINPDRQQRVDHLCATEGFNPRSPFVIIQPFSLWSYKELPLNHYVQLIEAIHRQFDIPVVIAGGSTEKEKAETVLDRCQCKVFNLVGKTSIGELVTLLSRSLLFVGIDSSGLHIAAAVGCPTVGIFGPSAPASWAPRGEQHKVVQPDEPCVPCRNKGCEDTEVSQCLQRLPVENILTVIEGQLQGLKLKKEMG